MEWQTVGTIANSSDYIFTPVVIETLFKLKHITETENRSSFKIAIRQAFEDDGSLAFFDYKLINCKNEQDIMLLSLPQGLTGRRLAFKRVDNLIDDWTIEIQTLVNDAVNNMPAYPSYPALPISVGTIRRITENVVGVYGTNSFVLSPANPNKVGTTITNLSEFNLHVSVGVEASFTAHDKILGMNEVFETPFNWCGEVNGISDMPDGVDVGSRAKIKDFFQ